MHQLRYIPLVAPGKSTILEQDLVQCHLAQSSLLDLTLFDGFLSTNMFFLIYWDGWTSGTVNPLTTLYNRLAIRVLFAYACMRFAVCPWICRHSWWTPRLLETAYMTRPSTSNNSCSSDLDLNCGILGVDFPWRSWILYWQVSKICVFFCICQFWVDLTSLL